MSWHLLQCELEYNSRSSSHIFQAAKAARAAASDDDEDDEDMEEDESSDEEEEAEENGVETEGEEKTWITICGLGF